MRIRRSNLWVVVTALALAAGGCSGSQTVSERPEEEPSAGAVAEVPAAAAESAGRPGAVAPAPGVEGPKVKNWALIEFVGEIEEADLRWLEDAGFHVDTVMGPRLVRGWLEMPAAGELITRDPRVARIHAQMR